MDKIFQKLICLVIITVFFISFLFSSFISAGQSLEQKCKPLLEEGTDDACKGMSEEECRILLNQCLEFYQRKSQQYEGKIAQTQKEKRTLQNQIYLFRNKVRRLNNEIYRSNLMIQDIGLQIDDTKESITVTSGKIDDSKEKLAQLLRLINREGKRSLMEIMLAEEMLSDFFDNLVALETLSVKNQELLSHIESLKLRLGNQKQSLNEEKGDLEKQVVIHTLQRQENRRVKAGQDRLLRLTEAEYQKYLREKKKTEEKVGEIRSRIVQLIGIAEGKHLSFGELLDIAKIVQGQTGIRPAFLLAIITQESALGRNVGQCYLADKASGASIHIRKGTRFSRGLAVPPRSRRNDLTKFLRLTEELGLDPLKTPISCPMAFGFGGAMGPAQFIPTTWSSRRHILEPFVQGIPNPWNVNHAFLASALYLRDLGGRNNERRAALRYFAGGNWANPRFAFYGNQVVRRINCLQVFIDHGTMTESCGRLIFIPK